MLTKQTNLLYAYRQYWMSKPGMSVNEIVYFLTQEFQMNSHFMHHINVRRKGLTAEP